MVTRPSQETTAKGDPERFRDVDLLALLARLCSGDEDTRYRAFRQLVDTFPNTFDEIGLSEVLSANDPDGQRNAVAKVIERLPQAQQAMTLLEPLLDAYRRVNRNSNSKSIVMEDEGMSVISPVAKASDLELTAMGENSRWWQQNQANVLREHPEWDGAFLVIASRTPSKILAVDVERSSAIDRAMQSSELLELASLEGMSAESLMIPVLLGGAFDW